MAVAVVWVWDGQAWQRDVAPASDEAPAVLRFDFWSAQNTEAQVGAMQAQPPPPEPGVRALGEWHRLMDPPAPERDPRD